VHRIMVMDKPPAPDCWQQNLENCVGNRKKAQGFAVTIKKCRLSETKRMFEV